MELFSSVSASPVASLVLISQYFPHILSLLLNRLVKLAKPLVKSLLVAVVVRRDHNVGRVQQQMLITSRRHSQLAQVLSDFKLSQLFYLRKLENIRLRRCMLDSATTD